MKASNDIGLEYDKKLDKFWLKVYRPLSVCWQITRRCNLNCSFCISNSKPDVNLNEMTTKDCLRVIKKLSEAGIKRIDLTGGEPLLRKDIFQLAKYAKDQGLATVVTSNGTLSPEIYLKLSKNCSFFQISLDGVKKVHETLRGKGNFQKTLNTIYLLKEEKIPFRINTIIHKKNARSMDNFLKLINKIEVKDIQFIFFAPQGRGFLNRKIFELKEDEKLKIKEKLIKGAQKFGINIKFHDYKINFHSCLLITPDGKVISQGYSEDECIIVGNILKHSIKEIWNSGSFNHLRHFLQYMRINY